MIRIHFLLLIFVCLPAYGGELFSLPENPYALDGQRSCGPRCVAFIDSLLGGNSDYSDIIDVCPPGPFGTTLEQLNTTLQDLGYNSLAFKNATINDICRLKHPTILHVLGEGDVGHFVVMLRFDHSSQELTVFNPPHSVEEIQLDRISERLSGFGLVISREPIDTLNNAMFPPGISAWDWLTTLILVATCISFFVRRSELQPESLKLSMGMWLCCALLASGCSNQNAKFGATAPRHVDFGRVISGTLISHTFDVQNTSDVPLKLLKVERSCSCLSVHYDDEKPIAPGESTPISVKFETDGKEGPYRQVFVVTTDSLLPELSTIDMSVTVHVDPKITAIPSQVMFGTITDDAPVNSRLNVRTSKPDLEKTFVNAKVEGCKFISIKLLERSAGVLTFDISLSDDCPLGDISGKITLAFQDEEVPELVVPVFGRKTGDVRVIPSKLYIDTNSGVPTKFRVSSKALQDFALTSVSADTGIKVDWQPDVVSSSHNLAVRVTGEPEEGDLAIRISTDHPRHQQVIIPLVVSAP